MISRIGVRIASVFRAIVPDPFVLAILLTILTAILALAFGCFPGDEGAATPAWAALLDAWLSSDGLWKFLAFGMQMCLVLVTGHALASSPLVHRGILALASRPRTTAQAAALIGLCACAAALVNWGLGLIVGALLARDVGRSMKQRGVRAHYPLLAAAGYTGLLVWHGGLSGSAPLSVTTAEGASKVLPAASMAEFGAGIPLGATLFSPLNLVVSGGLLILVPLVLAALAPAADADVQECPIDRAPVDRPAEAPVGAQTIGERLETAPWLAWILAAMLIAAFVRYAQTHGVGRIGLNEINAAMLALGLVFHGSLRSYVAAVEEGARGCAGIILQFPLYGGIMAMMIAGGLVSMFVGGIVSIGSETTTPLLMFVSAGVVNLFVPSGGGQWGIQGPIALEAGSILGIAPGKMVMAVAYGDELTNMLQPFWALPLLAITGVKARDIVGYTAIVMVVAGAWMGFWLLVL